MVSTWRMFPADVTTPDGVEWRECHVTVTGGVVFVHTWDHAAGVPEQRLVAQLTDTVRLPNPYAPRYASQADLVTEAGTYTMQRGSGCGCNNPLKYRDPLNLSGGARA